MRLKILDTIKLDLKPKILGMKFELMHLAERTFVYPTVGECTLLFPLMIIYDFPWSCTAKIFSHKVRAPTLRLTGSSIPSTNSRYKFYRAKTDFNMYLKLFKTMVNNWTESIWTLMTNWTLNYVYQAVWTRR